MMSELNLNQVNPEEYLTRYLLQKELSIQKITNLLSHVGFSSPPSWTKPFHILSNGQKFRVEIARILATQGLTIIDEFTSVVDRNVAQIGSYAISKTAKKEKKQIICLSCHRDIIEWLEPDWVYDMDIKQFSWRLLRRPKIKLSFYKVNYKQWELFKEHHYLTRKISKTARCYMAFWNDIPVAFTSCINMIGFKKRIREHRTVTLPDFQGIGIGSRVSETLAEIMIKDGYRYYSVTSHPSFIQNRIKNQKWRLVRKPSRVSRDKFCKNRTNATNRLTVSFEFIGK